MRNIEEILTVEKKDKFYIFTYLVDSFSLEEAKLGVDYRKKVTNNKPCYVIADIRLVKEVSKEVVNYLNNEGAIGIIAGAFILKKNFPAMFFNIYSFLLNTRSKAKAFNDLESAEKWLESQIN